MKNLSLIFILLLSSGVFAEENICPEPVNSSWDKMKESDFSKKNTQLRIDGLKEYFSKPDVVAEEYLQESLLIIEGGGIRQTVEYWKKQDNSENVSHWTKKFCEFMVKRAYRVH